MLPPGAGTEGAGSECPPSHATPNPGQGGPAGTALLSIPRGAQLSSEIRDEAGTARALPAMAVPGSSCGSVLVPVPVPVPSVTAQGGTGMSWCPGVPQAGAGSGPSPFQER